MQAQIWEPQCATLHILHSETENSPYAYLQNGLIVGHSYKVVLQNKKNEQTTTDRNMEESENLERNNQEMKEHIQYDSIYIKAKR